MALDLIQPNWPAPSNIQAFATTRRGGYSHAPYDSLNLALHVEDDAGLVKRSRDLLQQETMMPNPQWLQQVHSTKVIRHGDTAVEADACYSARPQQTCVIMTADCLPVLFCAQAGDWVAAVHAGWRGLVNGVLPNTVKAYQGESKLMAWIGPAISQSQFEVGDDVYNTFVHNNSELARFFKQNSNDKWWCDLAAIAEEQLNVLGVTVYQSGLCSYENEQTFFSHRRATHKQGEGAQTGRMATMIWMDE